MVSRSAGSFAVLLIILFPLPCLATSVFGAVYGPDLEPVSGCALEISSSSSSRSVIITGSNYSIDLPRGEYVFSIVHYFNASPDLASSEKVVVEESGEQRFDFILLPPQVEAPEDGLDESELLGPQSSLLLYSLAFAFLLLLFALLIRFKPVLFGLGKKEESISAGSKKEIAAESAVLEEKAGNHSENRFEKTNSSPSLRSLPKDLSSAVSIISSEGGRITQKALREKMNLSEAKASLLIDDLENRGLARRFKKGRGNVLVLKN